MYNKQPANLDLPLAAALALIATNVALSGANLGIVRTVFAGLLVFILPGYVALAVIIPDRSFRRTEQLVYTLGLSFSIAILCGLVLNYTPWGLITDSWAILLGGITVILSAVAWLRRRGQQPIEDQRLTFRPTLQQALMLGLAAVVVILAINVARSGVTQNTTTFTQLWMQPVQQDTTHSTVTLGIKNAEATVTSYKLRLVAGNQVIQEWPSIRLEPNGQWQTMLTLSAAAESTNPVSIEARLYRSDNPEHVYRHVSLSR